MKPKPTLRKICGYCPAKENFNWELMSSDRKSSVVISGNNSTAYWCRIAPARAAPPLPAKIQFGILDYLYLSNIS